MNSTETFQHYQVLRRDDGSLWELGRGAMGVTYKAFDVNLRSLVALKVINGAYLDHPVARQRFIREARAAAALRHRNIAHVYHLGMDAQSFFYAMEFVDGETLDSLVRRRGPLPAETVLQIALQAARALSAAARQRLVHRDIKPTHLMIVAEDDDGELHQTIKVIDFGLARSAVRGDASTHLTMGGFVGTPQYASPEQLEEKNVDGRSDIYSLGASLWYLLAGRPPFVGTLTSLISQHLTKEPPWELLATTPIPVRQLLERMLQKDPANRPQSAGELRREVEGCLRALSPSGPWGRDGSPSATGASAPTDEDGSSSNLPGAGNGLAPILPAALAPTVGSLIGGRYQIMRLVGEGSTGRVFQAHDLRGEGRTVALKMLYADLLLDQGEHEKLRADAARVQAAPHPGLLCLLDFDAQKEAPYLVTEWSGGLTLVDLLRRRGRLTVPEALVLLKQAVAVTDFARAHGLDHLELHLHQIFVLPVRDAAGLVPAWNGGEATELLARNPLSATLRIDPLGLARDGGDLATWAGELTLLPSASQPLRDRPSSVDGPVESTYLHRLARLFYELVEGAPLSGSQPAAGMGAPAFTLPGLGEAGSAALRRALTPDPGFSTDGEFFEALSRAAGYAPEDLRLQPSAMPVAPAPQQLTGPGASTADAPLSRARETTGLPPGAPPAKAARRTLRPLVQRQKGAYTVSIDLSVLRRRVAVFGGILVVGALAWLLHRLPHEPASPRFVPSVSDGGISTHAGALSSPSPQAAGFSYPTTAPTPEVPRAEESDTQSGSTSRLVPPSLPLGPATVSPQPEDNIYDWLDGTILAQASAPAAVTVPYAPGMQPGDEPDEDAGTQVPYAPGMKYPPGSRSGPADTEEDSTLGEDQPSSVARSPKGGGKSATNGKRARGHRRAVPPPRNFLQRLFGIKPKPRRGG